MNLPDLHPTLQTYGVAIGGVLVFAGAVLFVAGKVLGKNVGSVWATYRGWLVMAPTVLVALYLGRGATIVGISLLSIVAFKEFARATGLYKDWAFTIAVYIGIVLLGVLMWMNDPKHGDPGWYGMFMALPVFVIAGLLTIPVIRNRTAGQLQAVALSIVGFAYMGWMFGHLAFLTNSEHFYGYVLYLIFAVELNDVSAFTFGKLFGRHKLRDAVSPNKTIEGSLGALGVSMVLPWLMRYSFPHFGATELILTGLIVGVGGQLGDLTISFIKRDIGIKDMGSAITGHGGVLDRIDSLIFVAPLFFHMVRWFQGI